ncbi:MAG: glycosyltransferase family 39 protein [Candidatus Delongbacteria bacterium]|nr:glycosyltransferase family 39 protein [Candidatus Delongbacteria bacterium]
MLYKALRRYEILMISTFLFIWLCLISPFNQKIIDPELSVIELEFIFSRFLVLVIWVIIFLTGYILLKKNKKDTFFPFVLWNIIFFLLTFTFNIGFDLTDEGWQLSKSWWSIHGNTTGNFDLIWGSSFINGLWMSIPSRVSLIWSRFGFLLFFPFFSTVIYYILKRYYAGKYVFWGVVISFLFFYRNFLIYPYINYYYLPVFFVLLSILFLLNYEDNLKLKHLILSGLFAGISIHMKFTFILILPVYGIYLTLFEVDNPNKKRSVIIYYSALLSALITGFIILTFAGSDTFFDKDSRLSILTMFNTFFGSKKINSSLNYSFIHLTYVYSKDLGVMILHLIVPLILFISGAVLSKKYIFLKYFSWLLIGILLIVYKEQTDNNFLLVVSIFFALDIILTALHGSKNREIFKLNYMFLYVFFVSFLGSGMSIYAALISGGLFGFSAFIITALLSVRPEKLDFRILVYSLIVFILVIQFKKEFVAYRDIESRYLNAMFKSPELSGIYSFKERVDVVDEFISNAKKIISKDDKVFIVGMPMFYYILNIEPVISEPYDLILGLDQLKEEIKEQDPSVIITPVQSPRGVYWPLERNISFSLKDKFEISTRKYHEFYGSYISENGLIKVFSNSMFQIYKKESQ